MSDPFIERLEAHLAEAAEPLIADQPNGPSLWASLERSATAILSAVKRSGAITGFHVRCDAETSGGDAGPTVEVILVVPKRVQRLVLRIGPR